MICDAETYCDRLVRTVTGNRRDAEADFQTAVHRQGWYYSLHERRIIRAAEAKQVRELIPADKYSRL
jgi:hypothetical protein